MNFTPPESSRHSARLVITGGNNVRLARLARWSAKTPRQDGYESTGYGPGMYVCTCLAQVPSVAVAFLVYYICRLVRLFGRGDEN